MPHITTHSHTLQNGMRVIACPIPDTALVTVHVQYNVGSFNEDPSRTGLAHLFEHLMFDNTSTGVDKNYDALCTRAGGTNNAYTTYDHTAYHITLPSHQMELGLWLEADRMQAFAITDQALRVQQSVVVEEINQNVENQPYGQVWPTIDRMSFTPDSHYSWNVYGSAHHVESVSMEDATTFFHRYYQPANAVLVVAGGCNPEEVFRLADLYFGLIPSATIPHHPQPVVGVQSGQHEILRDRVPAEAAFITIPLPPQTDARIFDAEIVSRVIGGGTSSSLYQHLVHTTRSASYTGAFIDRRAHASLMIIYAYGLDHTITADRLVQEMQHAILHTALTPQAISKAVQQLRTAHAFELQRSSSIANEVAYNAMYFQHPEQVNTVLEAYASRTEEDVHAMFARVCTTNTWNRLDVIPA